MKFYSYSYTNYHHYFEKFNNSRYYFASDSGSPPPPPPPTPPPYKVELLLNYISEPIIDYGIIFICT